ncbi:hypothetical protein [Corynebacterium aquilae]|uniref:Uncharacterized protein n=1 Tax=Corynebacterium aquilae DSM 44791 TaxID=1431546 RepID=A0A1L7CHI2_9CORY|nr:hypothetical protein [Corynebacterium aquilae]APT85310.1 hypothetical protein CAQU_09790 [Corynebacterium aquilae DSM 44791]
MNTNKNKVELLSSTPVLRAAIYVVVGLVGIGALIAGAIDADGLTSWLNRVPAIAASVASVLALANLHSPVAAFAGTTQPEPEPEPEGNTPPALSPMEEYRARLMDAHADTTEGA